MAINLVKSAISVGVGVADEVLERQDVKAARVDVLKQWATWERLGGAALGYVGQMMSSKYANYAEALALSETPLAVKTIAQWVMPATAAAARVSNFQPASVRRTRVADNTTLPNFQNDRSY